MKFLRLKKAEVQQPNKPKPTTTLPDNMEWSWDPNAADWVAVLKNNTNVTPPLYNPQNQNMTNNNATTYMSTVKSSSNRALSTLPRLLEKCWYGNGNGRYAEIGNWSIGLGGYDTGYEVSYKGLPIFSITPNNELKEYLSEESLQRDCGLSYDDIEKVLKSYKDLGGLKRIQCKKQASKKYAGEEIDKINLDYMKDTGDTSYALNLLRDGIVTRESRHFDQLVENILNDGEGSAGPLVLLLLGILNENDRYYHNAVKQCLPHPTYAADLLERGIITKDSEYYIDAVNSAIRSSDIAKGLVEKGIIDEQYVKEENNSRIEKLRSALSEAILTLRESGERFYDLRLVWQDKESSEQYLKQALDVAANRLDKVGMKEDAEYYRGVLKQASKKVKSFGKIIKDADESDMEVIEKYAKECGDEIWTLFNGCLIHLLAYFPIENGTYKILYIPIVCLERGTGEPSYSMLTRSEDYKFYSECDPVNSADFSSLELLPGDDTYEQIGFVRNSSVKCLSEFLDGPRYSKEIKIEAGLIKNGLVKYAGFDFNRGTKYVITEKGLKVLRSAAEKEHNEALNEKEKLAYMFGFNTDKETTLDTTGKTIKADDKDIIVIDTGSGYLQVFENGDAYDYGGYSVGEQLYEFSINDEDRRNGKATLDVDDLLNSKFYGIIFEDFDKLEWFVQNIKDSNTQQEIKNLLNKEAKGVYSSKNTSNRRYTIIEADGTPLGKVTASSELDAKVKFGIEHPEYADSQSISAKEIKADDLYSPNHKDPKLGITIGEEERLIKQVAKDYEISEEMSEFIFGGLRGFSKDWKLNEQHIEIIAKNTYLRPIDIELIAKDFGFKVDENKKVESQYEQTTNTKEPYPNPSETPHDDIVLENHDGWVNTAKKK